MFFAWLIIAMLYIVAFYMWRKALKEEREEQKKLEEKRRKDEYLSKKYSLKL